MARVITYANNSTQCFCQIRLDSGERILVSGAQGQIKIFKLRFGGLIPAGTVWSFSASELGHIFRESFDFDRGYPMLHPLDQVSVTIMGLSASGLGTIAQLQAFFSDEATRDAVIGEMGRTGKRRVDEYRQAHPDEEKHIGLIPADQAESILRSLST